MASPTATDRGKHQPCEVHEEIDVNKNHRMVSSPTWACHLPKAGGGNEDVRRGDGAGRGRHRCITAELRQEARKNKSVARHSPPLPRAELVAHGRRHARPVDPAKDMEH